ncbi:MAG: 6,7-dimethyl-8-ribityllumazine synthase [Candidatus Thermoplasmatota archaeon]
MKIGIVVSEYNYDITAMMLERAKEHARFLGIEVAKVVHVPGVYDMPLAANRLLNMEEIDGVVVLGAVIEGETEHDEVIINQATRKLTDLSVEYDKPLGLGITGPGMSRLQAEERIDRAKDAVEAVAKLHKSMGRMA